tara:strand:+ start:125 stop:559 length:435 start_codon:yes stop_codon:yes gene_type:complete
MVDVLISERPLELMDKVKKTKAEWKEILTEEAFYICREKGTERPFSGKYNFNKEKGIYSCICCGATLFSSEHKYESGSGWPSFWAAAEEGAINNLSDLSHGMRRTEVVCRYCDSHLGHVFGDGPQPSGLRYCINSVSLNFNKEE